MEKTLTAKDLTRILFEFHEQVLVPYLEREFATKEDLNKLATKEDLNKLKNELKKDIKQLDEKFDAVTDVLGNHEIRVRAAEKGVRALRV